MERRAGHRAAGMMNADTPENITKALLGGYDLDSIRARQLGRHAHGPETHKEPVVSSLSMRIAIKDIDALLAMMPEPDPRPLCPHCRGTGKNFALTPYVITHREPPTCSYCYGEGRVLVTPHGVRLNDALDRAP